MTQKVQAGRQTEQPDNNQGGNSAPERDERLPDVYSTLIQASLDGFAVIDFEGNLLDCNAAACQMLGYTRDEALKLNLLAFEQNDQIEEIQARNHHIKETGADRFQTRYRGKDGSILDVEVSAQYDPALGERIYAFFRDITQRRQDEEALAVEKKFNEAILNSVPGMLYLYTADGRLVRWNKKHETLTGFNNEELAQMQLMDWFRGDEKSQKAVTDGLATTMQTGFGEAEAELQTKDDNNLPMYFTASPLTLDGQQYFAGIGIDLSERKQLQQSLQESEQRFRSLVENANDLVFTVTAEGVITYASPNWMEILGYDPSEVVGKSYTDFMHPDYAARGHAFLNKILKTGEKASGSGYLVRHKDGSWRWHITNAARILNADGKTYSFLGIARDVTERKKAEEALRESNETAQAILNAATESVFLMTVDGTVIATNETTAKRMGTTLEELVGKKVYQYVIPEVAAFRKKQMEIVLKERKPLQFEDQRFGAWIENTIYPIIDADGEIRRVAIYGRDITERKLAEEALRKVENRAKALVEHAPDGVALIGFDGCFKYVSPSGRRIFGYSADQVDLPHPNDLTHPEDLGMVLSALSELIQNPALIPTLVYRFKHKNGSWLWTESTFTNLLSDPNVEGIVINFRDVTERKKAEQAFRESEEHFRSLYHQSPIGIELYDVHGNLVDINLASQQIFGVENVDEVKGLNLFNDPQLPDSVKERARRGQAVACEYTFEFDAIHEKKLYKTNKTKKMQLYCVITPWNNANGDLGGYFLQVMDTTEQKQAQDALQESQRRLATLLSNLPGMAFRCKNDPDWTMEFVSQGCYDLTGYYDHELLRNDDNSYARFIHPDDRQMVWNVIEQRVANKQAYTVSYRIITPAGEEKWVWEQGQGVYDPHGDLEALEGFISDITLLKRSEEALRQNEALLHQSQEQANMGSFVWDLRNDALTWSPNMYAIHGLDGDQFEGQLGKVSNQLIHPDDRARVAEEIGKMVAAKRVWPMEFRVLRPDGVECIMQSDGVFDLDAQGQPVRCIGIHQDITERRQAEIAIQQAQANLIEAQRVAKLGSWIWDLEKSEVKWSDELFRIFGLDPSQGVPPLAAFLDLLHPEDRERLLKAQDSVLQTGKSIAIEYRSNPALGIFKEFIEKVEAGFNEAGQVIQLMGTLQDITERKQAENEIRKLNDELEQRVSDRTAQLEAANKELEAFSYSISHDLRAPLRGIDGWSQALLEEYGEQLDETAHTYLGRVRSESQRMGRLIDDVLRLSRMTRSEMHLEPVDLSAMARTIIDRLRESQPERQVEVIIQEGLISRGDARLLEVTLTNLFDNAFKFTSKIPNACVEFGQKIVQGEPAFFVRDNGAGFDMSYASKLFGAFQRMHRTADFPGTGIGLATVQRIIRRHGGKVWADAHVNAGAEFFFTLGEN